MENTVHVWNIDPFWSSVEYSQLSSTRGSPNWDNRQSRNAHLFIVKYISAG